ncbi:MAG TPA: hypothetical protein VFN62_13250, partial [Acidobacteriaceae bacterium]|nr:hypothetical protein [Acidobacteriaceae bacterium]
MTKEIYISSTPHETRLAVVEDDQLAEIYYERENEYTLAGSIYKGKVTRVLPGMQSAFVDIGLERDAFLYVTDFAEEQEDGEEYVSLAPGTRGQTRVSNSYANTEPQSTEDSISNERRPVGNQAAREGSGTAASSSTEDDGQGGRRWRGRRGRRRGRGGLQNRPAPTSQPAPSIEGEPLEFGTGAVPHEPEASFESAYPEETAQPLAETRVRAIESARPPLAANRPEALVLPGESLSKYHRGVSPAPSTTVQQKETPALAPTPTFQPTTMVTAPLGEWDGSEVLPGESLSRHKRSRTASPAESFSSPAAEVGPLVEETPAPAPVAATPVHVDETPMPVFENEEPSLVQHETMLEEPSLVQHATVPEEPSLVQHDFDEATAEAAEIEATEFEPSEASASYRFDPTTPSAYRQSSVAEPPAPQAEAQPATESSSPDAAAEPTPEAASQQEPFFAEAASIVQPTQSRPSEQGSTSTEEVAPAREGEKAFVGEDYASHLDEIALDEQAVADHDDHIFDPGLGNLEEETIDEEEAEAYAAQSPLDEGEYDDLVEETLDVQMDSGMLSEFVRDRHVEQRTRFAGENEDAPAEGAEGEEDFSEDETFAAELGEIELEALPESADE